MTNERKEELQRQCSKFRNDLIDLLYSIQTGHPGGSLSCTEILTSLYFEIMNVNPEDPEMEGKGPPDSVKKATRPHAVPGAGGERLFPQGGVKDPAPDGQHASGPSLRT